MLGVFLNRHVNNITIVTAALLLCGVPLHYILYTGLEGSQGPGGGGGGCSPDFK